MEEYDSYEGSGLDLFHLSDVLDYLGEGNKIEQSGKQSTFLSRGNEVSTGLLSQKSICVNVCVYITRSFVQNL